MPYLKKIGMKFKNKDIEIEMVGNIRPQTTNEQDLGYSVNDNRPIKLSEVDFTRNTMVVGASGWGKSYLLKNLMENSLQSGNPLVLIDPKGSLEDLHFFRQYCDFYKKKLFVFSDNYIGPERRCFNPIREYDDVRIVSVLMRSLDWEGADQFYITQAQNCLFQVMKTITENRLVPSIPLIYEIATRDYGSDKEVSGLLSKLRVICEGPLGRNLLDLDTDPAVNMAEAISQGYCLYIGISSQLYGTFAKTLGKVFTNEILQISGTRNSQSIDPRNDYVPFAVYIDEAGSVIEPDFLDLINKSRSSGVQICTAVQSLEDFERVLPGITTSLVECYSAFFITRQTDGASVEKLANMFGTSDSIKKTKQTNDDMETGGGSLREVEKFRIHPNMIKSISIGQTFLVSYGMKTEVHLVNVRNPKNSPAFKHTIGLPKIYISKRNFERKKQYQAFALNAEQEQSLPETNKLIHNQNKTGSNKLKLN